MATSATLYGNSGGSGIEKTINLATPFNSDVTTVTADDNIFWTKATIKPKSVTVTTKQTSSIGDYTISFATNTTINKLLGVEVYLASTYQQQPIQKFYIPGMFLFAADDSYITSGSTGFSVVKLGSVDSAHSSIDIVTDTHYAVTYSGKTLTIARTDSFTGYRFYKAQTAAYYNAIIHYV